MHIGLKLREVCKLARSPDAEHRTVRCSPDLDPGSNAKRADTGLRTLDTPACVRCLTLAELGSLHTGRTDTASGASGPTSGEHSRDFSKFPTGAIENIHFIFSKSTESRLASSAGRREEPILSLPFKLYLLLILSTISN